MNIFGTYDGNILGGLLLGFGMTLTGACPGTVLPQVVTSVSSGPLVLLGGVLGGILWSGFGKRLLVQKKEIDPFRDSKKPTQATVYQNLGISEGSSLVAYEIMCLGMLSGATLWAPGGGRTLVPPIVGGLFVGLSQFASLFLTTNTLGVSTTYEQIGDLFWWLWSSFSALTLKQKATSAPSINSMTFALGTLLGSWALSRTVTIPASPRIDISTLRAVFGGVVMTFGSRLAGGCTSGHGISGMSMLSISSFISVAGMFVGGMGLAMIMG